MKNKTLDRMREGERGRLLALPLEHPLYEQLSDLGWRAGSEILCVRRAHKKGPYAYRTAGVTVALRMGDAAWIGVISSIDEEDRRGV